MEWWCDPTIWIIRKGKIVGFHGDGIWLFLYAKWVGRGRKCMKRLKLDEIHSERTGKWE